MKTEDMIKALKEKGYKIEKENNIIGYNDKKFKIVVWENKQIQDCLKENKGWELAKERDFIDMYDDDLIELEKYPVVYFTKNRSKKNIKNGFCLSRLLLNRNLSLNSNWDNLQNSNSNGRVVLCKELKK